MGKRQCHFNRVFRSLTCYLLITWLYSCQQQTRLHQQTATSSVGGECNSATQPASIGSREQKASLLIHAMVYQQFEDAFQVIRQGADVTFRDQRGNTVLYYAASLQGEEVPELVRLLVAKGAVVNVKCRGGDTPLHAACETGMPEVVTYLLEQGASVNAVDDCGYSPLHIAAIRDENDRDNIVNILLTHGGDPTLKTRRGQTAPNLAVEEHGEDVNLLRLLSPGSSKSAS